MTQKPRRVGCYKRNTLLLTLTKPPDPEAQSEGATPAELQAQVEKLANMVLLLEDLLQRQSQEMEELRRQLSTNNEGSQTPKKRRNSQPPPPETLQNTRTNQLHGVRTDIIGSSFQCLGTFVGKQDARGQATQDKTK
jgi:hypothetical protein